MPTVQIGETVLADIETLNDIGGGQYNGGNCIITQTVQDVTEKSNTCVSTVATTNAGVGTLQTVTVNNYNYNIAFAQSLTDECRQGVIRDIVREFQGMPETGIAVTSSGRAYKYEEKSSHVDDFKNAPDVASATSQLRKLPAARRGATRFIASYDSVKYNDPPSQSAGEHEVEVTFKNLSDNDSVIAIILGEDIDKPNPRKWAIRPGFLIRCSFPMNMPHYFIVQRGRVTKTFARRFSRPQQDLDVHQFFT